jgi:palmitoyltransferase ZDHHC13/17
MQLDIFAASQQGKTEQIRALIESGRARVTDRGKDRITPLHMAAFNGRLDACAYLIEQGAEVNAVGGELLDTPLHWAARRGRVETIDLLIRHGANPRLFDAQGFNCIHSATRSLNNLALVYILCQPGVAVDERDHSGRTALHWAVGLPDDISTQILLKMGADPNAMDCDGFTPLHRAALAGSTWYITDLLEAGADIRARNRDGRTALEIAAKYHEESVWIWKMVVKGLGFKPDGTRVRRPLSEVRGYPGGLRILVKQVPASSNSEIR